MHLVQLAQTFKTPFKNEHLRPPLPRLLSATNPNGSGSKPIDHETINLWKALLGLERVRSEVNVSVLPRPPSFHRGVYVFDGDNGGTPEDDVDSNGGADGYHTGDPLPEAWVHFGRYDVEQAAKEPVRSDSNTSSRDGVFWSGRSAVCGYRLTRASGSKT